MSWIFREWRSLDDLVEHLLAVGASEQPSNLPRLLDLVAKVRSGFSQMDQEKIKTVPVRIIPEARFNAYAMSTDQGPVVALDYMMITLLPAFAVITWGLTDEDPDNPKIFDPRQLIWLACAVHMGELEPVMKFPCWHRVLRVFGTKVPEGAPTRDMVDIALGWILAHEFGHIIAGHLKMLTHERNHEFKADSLATEAVRKAFKNVGHLPWAMQNVFLFLSILEEFEPTGETHPAAPDRLTAMRQQLLQMPGIPQYWEGILSGIQTQNAHLTSFNADGARLHWKQVALKGGTLEGSHDGRVC